MAHPIVRKQQRSEDLVIVENRKINQHYFVLTLLSEIGLPEIIPGHFVNVLVQNSPNTFLRRPISVYDVQPDKNTLQLLIQIVGDGTNHLATLEVGDKLNILYPLGEGFTFGTEVKKAFLVGGGVGLAPLLYLAKKLHGEGIDVDVLIGGRSKENIIEVEKFEEYSIVHISTNDGSAGEPGLLTTNSIMANIKDFDKVYTCGPDIMMRAVAKIAKENQVECEVSLENLMACGIGACLCCVTPTTTGHRCVCTDGPVFNIKELNW